MCYSREQRFVPFGAEAFSQFKNRLYNNCSTSGNGTFHERLFCHLLATDIYGENTEMLADWIMTDRFNSGQRGYDCVTKAYESTKDGFCDYTYDTNYCIRQIPENSTIYLACPSICPGYSTTNVSEALSPGNCALFGQRHCGVGGVWDIATDYGACGTVEPDSMFFNETLYLQLRHEDASENIQYTDDDWLNTVFLHFFIWPLVGSLLCLVIAFVLFLNRRLQCLRVFIHQNLIVSWILKYTFTLLLVLGAFDWHSKNTENLENLQPTNSSEIYNFEKTFWLNDAKVRKAVRICEQYFYLVGSTWFFIEALFLQYQISMNVFGAENRLKTRHIALLGWSIPTLISIFWIIFIDRRYQILHADQKHQFQETQLHANDYNIFIYQEAQWSSINDLTEHLIIALPQLIMLILNFLILLNIVRIIVSKVRVTASDDYEVFKKSFKATFSLLPLFGLGIILGLWSVDYEKTFVAGHAQTIITLVMQNSQGIFIAVIYCFMNKEVQRRVRQKVNTIATRHSSAFYSRATDISNFSGISESFSARWTKTIKRVSERSRASNTTEEPRSDSRAESLLHSADSYSNLDATSI